MTDELAIRVEDLVDNALAGGLDDNYVVERWRNSDGVITFDVTDRAGRPKCRVRVFP